jgi:hypothetical protein
LQQCLSVVERGGQGVAGVCGTGEVEIDPQAAQADDVLELSAARGGRAHQGHTEVHIVCGLLAAGVLRCGWQIVEELNARSGEDEHGESTVRGEAVLKNRLEEVVH